MFIANRTFQVGDLYILEGSRVEFDGTNAVIDGKPMRMLELRGAVRAGWLATDSIFRAEWASYTWDPSRGSVPTVWQRLGEPELELELNES